MLRMIPARFRTALPLAMLVVAAGCKGKEKQTETVPAAPPPAAAPAQQPVRVSQVQLGKSIGADKKVTNATTEFGANDTIYAVVATDGTAATATLSARWTYQDGQTVDETSQSIAPTGPATTEFHVSKPGGWPTGKYQVQVSLNGSPVDTKEFTVR